MRLLGVGGAHIDRRGRIAGEYTPAASNPGTMLEDIGGGALNALRNAAQRGMACSLISVRGGDAAGEQVARSVEQAGIRDLSATFLDRGTPSYTALIDREGELIAGFSDMGLYDHAFPRQMRRSMTRDAIGEADAVLCDANVPAASLERLAELAVPKPIYAIGVSPAKVRRLAGMLPALACAFLNRREAATLAGSADWRNVVAALQGSGLRAGIITAGGETMLGFDQSGTFALDPPSPRRIVDVTGAGDALAGATIAAMLAGKHLRTALREGVAASILAIGSKNAVPALEKAAFADVLALVPEPVTVA